MNSNLSTLQRLITCAGLGMLLCLSTPAALGQRQLLDQVIAIIDKDVLLLSELEDRLTDIRGQAAANNEPLPAEDVLRAEVLEALIVENLQMQFAERVSIRFDDDTINRVLENMARNNDMTFDQYIAMLEERDVYIRTREQVRKQLTLQELQRGIVNRRITISDQEIENFLNSEMGREVMAAEFFVNHMVVVSDELDAAEIKEAKRKFAADLVARLQDGEEFATVFTAAQQARIYLVQTTNFDWLKAEQFPTLFSDIVGTLSLNEVEGPIPAGNGFHIIQLADKRGGTEQIVSQTHIRHIMLTPNEIRDEDQTLSAIQDLRQRIIDGEEFADLARQNSDDATSVVAGGDLDWVSTGGMPAEMEQVVATLALETISEPFRTDGGWHIAEVLGRRDEDLSGEYARRQADNALRNRKFDLELQNWLIEIRAEAFVELVE
ncbi:MAG: molecular chaperone SurA [Gammaproteobacteria bacterium]|nr:molecular chaperone SurA [Gammaproteobacteria bacterium]